MLLPDSQAAAITIGNGPLNPVATHRRRTADLPLRARLQIRATFRLGTEVAPCPKADHVHESPSLRLGLSFLVDSGSQLASVPYQHRPSKWLL
jgi:hypothetical protein